MRFRSVRWTESGILLGLAQAFQCFFVQWRAPGSLLEILQQFAGEVRLAWKLSAAHHRREGFIATPFRRFQFDNGVHLKLNGMSRHEAKLPENGWFDKSA